MFMYIINLRASAKRLRKMPFMQRRAFVWLLYYCALLDGWLDEVITPLQSPLSPAQAAGPGQRNCVSAEGACAKVTSPQNKQDTAALSATCALKVRRVLQFNDRHGTRAY